MGLDAAIEDTKDLDFLKGFGELALDAITFAAMTFPEAWPLVEVVYEGQCEPGKIVKAGLTWVKMVETINDAKDGVDTTTGAVTHDHWHGKDRASFDGEVSNYQDQLGADQAVGVAVGPTMVIVGLLLAVYMIAFTIVSCFLAVLAFFCDVAALTGYGLEAAAEIQVEAAEFVESSTEMLESVNNVIERISDGGAAWIGATITGNVGSQLETGNYDAITNLVQATVVGGLDTVAGLMSKKEQGLTAKGIGNESSPFIRSVATGYGLSTTHNGSEWVDTQGKRAFGDQWDKGGEVPP